MTTSPNAPASLLTRPKVELELTKQAVQGAHLALKACKLAVAKPRYDKTPEDMATNDLHKQATQALRRKCKDGAYRSKCLMSVFAPCIQIYIDRARAAAAHRTRTAAGICAYRKHLRHLRPGHGPWALGPRESESESARAAPAPAPPAPAPSTKCQVPSAYILHPHILLATCYLLLATCYLRLET